MTGSPIARVFARHGRGRAIAASIVAVASAALGFLPLFAGPGYEQSVAAGLLLPTPIALVAAAEGFDGPHAVSPRGPLDLVLRGLRTALLLAAISLVVAVLHALRVGFCDPLGGVATFALTAFAGSLLAGAVGATSALIVGHAFAPTRRRRRIAMWIAGLAPLATALVALGYFYATPAVFAFDPVVGFFSGTLYDEVVDAWEPLLTYRAGTACSVLACVIVAGALERDEAGRLSIVRRPLVALGAAFALVAGTFVAFGPELGHRSTAGSMRRELGGARVGDRCEVVYPRAIPEPDAALLLRDCVEALASVERALGVRGPDRVTAFFFRDSDQKRRLMGAADTYVAKPWRREVYLQMGSFPHPVLGHELAHVVAGAIARGPFRVAGALWGLLPNPGLIEGIAVAASPDRDELAPEQWSRAMKELGILPRLSRTFGGGFLAQNSSMAYTVAGSFVRWAFATGKGDAVRAWYGGAPFAQAFGMSFEAAEDAWRASLDAVPLPDEALKVAKGRFDRPAIWGRRCPHVVERLREEAETCREEGDLAAADDKLRTLLELDAVDPSARIQRARLSGARGDLDGMRAILRAVEADARVSSNWRNRAREALADLALHEGALDEARRLYELARAEVLDEDWARTLDVKTWAATAPHRAALFGRLLVRGPRLRDGRDEATAATIALARTIEIDAFGPGDRALARYLVARRLADAKAWDEAEDLLEGTEPELLGRISEALVRERARLLVLAACMRPKGERADALDAAARAWAAAPGGNAGKRQAVERLIERCR